MDIIQTLTDFINSFRNFIGSIDFALVMTILTMGAIVISLCAKNFLGTISSTLAGLFVFALSGGNVIWAGFAFFFFGFEGGYYDH